MAIQRATNVWVDSNGLTRSTLLTTSAGQAAVAAALVAKSNADIAETWEGNLVVALAPLVTAAPLQSVRDIARLVYATTAGRAVSIILPAPLISIFLADQQTVDPTQVAAITTAVLANVVDAAGNAATSFIGGIREPS